MIFWILLGIAIVAVIASFAYGVQEDLGIGFGFLNAFLATLIAALVGGLLMLLLSIWFGPSYQFQGEKEHGLVALQTSSSIEGRSYFLGSGYINGKRTLNYITDDGGAFRVESADADDSVIYQDSDSPTVTVHEWDLVNPWFAPWSFGHRHTYTFHVPEGSILSDYTVNND